MNLKEADKPIENVILKARACISNGLVSFTYAKEENEREKNQKFLCTYLINSNDRLEIIKSLKKENLLEISKERVKNNSVFGELYIFGIKKELIERETGNNINVSIYIKFQFFDFKGKKDGMLVVSFHEAEQKLSYIKWK